MNNIYLVYRHVWNEVHTSSEVIAAYHNENNAIAHTDYLEDIMRRARLAKAIQQLQSCTVQLHTGPYADLDSDCTECQYISYSMGAFPIKD